MKILPLGLRNNNPLNIRFSSTNPWVGQVGKERGFCKFSNITYGYRAAMKIMKGYHKYHLWTVRQMIERWAPPEDHNATDHYIMYVCNHAHVPDHQKLLFNHTPADKSIVTKVVAGMALVENGVKWKAMIKPDDIAQAYDML